MFVKTYFLSVAAVSFQILGLSPEPGGVADELHEVHHQPAVPALPLRGSVRSAGHAALRRQVGGGSGLTGPSPSPRHGDGRACFAYHMNKPR